MSDRLITLRLPNGRRRLLEPLIVRAAGRTITIPAGFETDYSSIPLGFRNLIHWSRVDIAGVAHDYLYSIGADRKQADTVWACVAQQGTHHANFVQAALGYAGLRVGGWWAYRQHRKQREHETLDTTHA